MLWAALIDLGQEWDSWNDYGRFIYSLFKPSSPKLDDRKTIINFNYDGLLEKLLVDAMRERCRISGRFRTG